MTTARKLSSRAGAPIAVVTVLAALAGCLDVPEGPAPMCHTSNDCATTVEVCDEGVCWGNPPSGPFAAVVSPPSTRRDLVSRELPEVMISDDGSISGLSLEAPVTLTGRVTAFCEPPIGCDAGALGATITLSRSSQFQGGPGFKTVVNVDATADTFSIPVPRTGTADDMYTITVVPSAAPPSGGSRSPAELVPPLRTLMSLPDTTPIKTVKIVLGGANLPQLTGTLTNASGEGLVGYRVSAFGRWDRSEPATEVSSVATTDASGAYSITLSDDLFETVELIARPPLDPMTMMPVAATVHRTNINAAVSSTHDLVVPANLGKRVDLFVDVSGVDLNGTVSAVPGAVVTVSGGVTALATNDSFTITTQQITDKEGPVRLHLLDGPELAASYKLSIVPPASSRFGVLFDQSISLTPGAPTTTLPKRLLSRFMLSGQIVDSSGRSLSGVSVTARPSLRFLWELDTVPQAFVAAIPAASTVTVDGGGFSLWVDASVAQTGGTYELVIEPQAQGQTAAQVPTYIKTGVAIPSDAPLNATAIDPIVLPDAAYVRGQVTGPDGAPVDNAELKLYQVSASGGASLCSDLKHAPLSCPIPAQLQGRNTSDASGVVRLALPR